MRCFFLLPILFLIAACEFSEDKPAPTPADLPRVNADVETPPVPAPTGNDAADDPAIWVHPQDSTKSLIIGTVKHYGLEVYDLNGKLQSTYKIGNPNNVDVRYGFPLADGSFTDIAACSDRAANEVLIFRINAADGRLTEVESPRIQSDLEEVYGFCLYKSAKTGDFYVFINGKDGSFEQYRLIQHGQAGIAGIRVRTFRVNSQPEGLVADDRLGVVYLGEEDKGIWKLAAEPDQSTDLLFLQASTPAAGRPIKYDVEGLAVYPTGDSTGYLIASSQGNNTYAVFDRQGDNRYLGSFVVGDTPGGPDGTAETDGLDVTTRNLGGPFAEGMFVAQDGFNVDAQGKAVAQNFKLVGWSKIRQLLEQIKK